MRTDKVVTEVLGEDFAMTPSDIFGKKFKRAMVGGYDRRQVDRFLERVADVFERVLEQLRNLRGTQQEQKARIDEYRDMENTLRTALGASQQLAEEILASARREAQTIIEEGRIKQARLELEGRRLPDDLRREVQLLEQQRDRLRAELSAVLESHRGILDAHLPRRSTPPSLTNLEFLPASEDAEDTVPVFAPDPYFGGDLPDAMVFEPAEDDEDSTEEPEPPRGALNSSAKPNAGETHE